MNRRPHFFPFPLVSRILILLGFAAAVSLAACGEKLQAGAACPVLCPNPDIIPRDTLVEGVVVDSTLAGFPALGQENILLLASRGDTLDTRVIFRFDTIAKTYGHSSAPADTIVNHVDSATLRIVLDTATLPGVPALPKVPVRVELYDVDSPGDSSADTVAANILPRFTSDRLLGAKTFAPESLAKDTVFLPVSPAAVLTKIVTGARLRIGLRLVANSSTQLRIFSSSTAAAELRFKPAADTAVHVSLLSKTPTDSTLATFRTGLKDFVITAKAPPGAPPNTISVGGFPARRTYLRFQLPSHIVDSSNVVRASLTLTQYPMRGSPSAGDSLAVYPFALTAGTVVTDISRLMAIANINTSLALDSVRVVPADSGARRFELVNLVKIWRSTNPATTQRALILVISEEGSNPAQATFYSSKASSDLRPRLELTYVPKIALGLP